MAELKIQLTGDDIRKLVSGEDAKVSIAPIVYAVGKDYMKDVDVIAIRISPDVSTQIIKHYVEDVEIADSLSKKREEKQT